MKEILFEPALKAVSQLYAEGLISTPAFEAIWLALENERASLAIPSAEILKFPR